MQEGGEQTGLEEGGESVGEIEVLQEGRVEIESRGEADIVNLGEGVEEESGMLGVAEMVVREETLEVAEILVQEGEENKRGKKRLNDE